MKYATTKNNRNRMKQFLMLALMVFCGNMLMGQGTWKPAGTTSATYALRSYGQTGNNFKVYQVIGNDTTLVSNNYYTKINGRINLSPGVAITLIFENTRTILFDGQFDFNGDNSSLTMRLGNLSTNPNIAHSSNNPTLKIVGNALYSGQKVAFYLRSKNSTDVNQRKLIIEGAPATGTENIANFQYNWDNNFVIDGDGPNLAVVDGNSMSPKVQASNSGQVKDYGLFRLQQGTLHLTNVTVQNFSTSWINAGMAQVFTGTATAGVDLKFEHCYFTQIGARSSTGSPVLRMQGQGGTNDNRNALLKNCEFENIFGSYSLAVGSTTPVDNPNATVRTLGNNKVPLTIEGCHFKYNYGCPVRWHGCGSTEAMLVKDCLIENSFTYADNTQVYGGGGLLLKGPATINNCEIRNNRTTGNGGGIYLSTYIDFNSGTPDLIPEHTILRLDSKTKIHHNIANQNGGGVTIEANLMRNKVVNYTSTTYLANTDGYIYWTSSGEPFKAQFIQNGGQIYNNTANGTYGGGVYITRPANAPFYKVECSLDFGLITNNKTGGNGTTGNGGGVAIKTERSFNNYYAGGDATYSPAGYFTPPANVEPQDVIIDVSVPYATPDAVMLVNDNKAGNGGGIYVEAYPIELNSVTSQVKTTVYDNSLVDNDTATINGGGLYVEIGEVSILQEGTESPTIQTNNATNGNGGGVFLNNGSVDMKGATIGGDASTSGNKAGKSGGGIYVNSGTVTMLSSDITYNKAQNEDGGGVYVNTGDVLINHKEQSTGKPSKINHNTAQRDGGGIFDLNGKVVVFGAFSGDNTYRVEISQNTTETGDGGGIYCMGSGTGTEYDIRMRRVKLEGNTAGNDGGGIYLNQGRISIINGWLLNNTAGGGGGGVYTQNGNIDINITGEERQPSRINGNKAKKNGGGLNTHSGFITVRGKSKNDRIQIIGNVAGYSPGQETNKGSGGGAFCMGGSGETEYITMRHVDLTDNMAKGGDDVVNNVTMGSGGGLYLQEGIITVTDVAIQSNKAEHNGGGINNHKGSIDVNGCLIGGASDKGNEAGNSGGGIYTNEGDIDIEDYVETEGSIQRIESKITYNSAGVNGGGVDTRKGTIWVNKKEMDDQIEISHNTANKGGGLYANAGSIITYNALIHDNTATENGGGINNHAGDITLHGGILSNNRALNGHGGGAYTFVGDIDLFQFPSTKLNDVTLNDGTKVFNNIALKNGGAFNNHTGRVDVRHATIYNNTATQGNGGAIFCEGPHANTDKGLGYTIRLLCSDMIQNKTLGQDGTQAEPTGRGGGIYLKYGDIYAHYSNIHDNEANINGGGIDNHQGNILLYGCEVKGNRAVELDGGGIYTYEGNVTTGPSTKRELPLGAKITIIENNSAHRDGGGINNQKGNINLNGDRIGSNQALTGDGGGVYIADGNITLNGGKIEYNSATYGNGGGVYSGGGVFDIHEREENPNPIVLIVDSQVQRDSLAYVDNENEPQKIGIQKASIHYHLVDQGKYEGLVENSVKHGIIWYKNEGTPTEHKVYYEITEGGYTYIQGEPACQRIVIPNVNQVDGDYHLITGTGIEANSTYKVKAFFEYQYNDGTNTITKIGYSEELEFVTYSSEPLVLSGAVSNITSISAVGSGKIMDPGDTPITARGVQIWTGNSTPPEPSTDNLRPSVDNTDFFTVDLRKKVDENTYINLNSNTTYYARAYATNVVNPTQESDYSFGNTVEFTTLKNTPDMGTNSVVVSHTIENDSIIVTASFTMPEGTVFGNGENQVQGYGFVWSTDDDPELHSDHTVAGTLVGNTLTFTAAYRGAAQGTRFYVRAYATYVESTVTASSDPTNYGLTIPVPYFTPYVNGTPVVRAINISGITQTMATVTCQIYSGYEAGTTVYGVHLDNYDQTIQLGSNPQQPNYSSPYIQSNNYNNGTYSVTLNGLIPGTTYHLKAYATNDNGANYSYGNGYNFTALPITKPTVVTKSINYYTEPSAIDHTKVDVVCEIENDGGGEISAYGINWGQVNNDGTLMDGTSIAGSSLNGGEYTITIEGLTAHAKYWVSAYATNSEGTHTCQPVIFETNFDQPNVTITSIDNVDFAIVDQSQNEYIFSAQGNFNVTPHSDATSDNVKTYGVCWSILHEPTRSKSVVSNTDFADSDTPVPPITGNAAVACSTSMTQTHANTKYYVRAYASTATANDDPDNGVYSLDDIKYSSESSFITLPVMFTNAETAKFHDRATLTGRIGSRDTEGYLVHDANNTNPNGLYGVCWGASENPTRGQGGATNYVEQTINNSNASTFDFSLEATGLTKNTTYHYRAYSINKEGNIAYGSDRTFTTRANSVVLTANPSQGGWVSGSYASLESNAYTAVATANEGYTFTNWTEGGTQVSNNATYDFTVTADRTLQANFTINTYTIMVAANPATYGSVTGGGTYNYGTVVNLVATPNTGYKFVNWTLNGEVVSGEDNYTITVTANANYVANFEPRNYVISVSANPENGGTITGGGTYAYNTAVTLTATANTGYTFTNWTENGTVVSTDPTYSFNATSDRDLVANFSQRRTTSRPRDIYPAPAREPWNWDEDDFCTTDCHAPLEMTDGTRDGEPTVTTGNNVAYTMSGAVFDLTVNGTVTDVGTAQLTDAGIWYSTVGPDYDATSNAGTFVEESPLPNVGAQYSVDITVTTDQIYYYRAYATNNSGASYGFGEAHTFIYENPTVTTSDLTNISSTGVTAGGTVTNAGSDDLTAMGVWYSTNGPDYDATSNPGAFAWAETPTLNTPYSLTINLSSGQSYYIRACATNNYGMTYGFGEVRILEYESPTVSTLALTNITATGATAKGTVTDKGTVNITEAGIWYSKNGNTYDASTNQGVFVRSTSVPAVGEQFSVDLDLSALNLADNETCYIRAYASNNGNLTFGFGNVQTFTNSSHVAYECLPSVNHNNAKNGGGIYIASGGKIMFSSGNINLNEAKDIKGVGGNGGGIYLEEGSIMHMKGSCEVNGNHTPDFSLIPASNGTDKDTIVGGGAGIYLDGKLYVGNNIDDPLGTHHLFVNRNYAMTNFTEAEYEHGDYDQQYYLRNNVFLPYPTNKANPKYFDAYTDYTANQGSNGEDGSTANNELTRAIALLSDISNVGDNVYSSLGFSVTKGKIPVVTTSKKTSTAFSFENFGVYSYTVGGQTKKTEEWMNAITDNMNSASSNASIFDDARAYIAIHAREDDDPFRFDFIYLWDCWTTPVVKYDPALYDMYGHELAEQDDSHYTVEPLSGGKKLWHIKDEKGLAWFSAHVNRLNGTREQYSDNSYAELEAVLEADLDMTEYLWVPIGSVRERQTGVNTIFRDIDDTNEGNVDDNLGFRGKFNGQGHLITGIDCRYISGMQKYGLFGNLEEGAVVENTFVDASSFRTNDNSKHYHVGGIAGLMEDGSTVRASEARFDVDLARANKATSYVGGIAGQVVGTNENPAIIHSSMAMPEIHGEVDYMGGLVGKLGPFNKLLNSFSNPKFPEDAEHDIYHPMNPGKYIGGLVGENNGIVENCYSRLQGNEPTKDGTHSVFGWLAGTNMVVANTNNMGGIRYCYALEPGENEERIYVKAANPDGITNQSYGSGTEVGDNLPYGHGTYSETKRFSDKYGFKHRDHQMAKAVEGHTNPYIIAKTNDTLIGGLQHALNNWVKASSNGWNTTNNTNTNGYAVWTRTMASHINDDYPVPMLTVMNEAMNKTFNSVGSKDEIYLLYEDNINDMWTAKKFDTISDQYSPRSAMYLYDVQPIVEGDKPANVTISGNVNVPLYIHEDIGITQPANAELTARAGVTIKNARKGDSDFTNDPNWHLFSSAIKNVPIGIEYRTWTDKQYVDTIVWKNGNRVQHYSHKHAIWIDRTIWDPPVTKWYQSDHTSPTGQDGSYRPDKIGYFPTNTPYGRWRNTSFANSQGVAGFFDLYEYNEYYYHWINYKREGTDTIQDHWHWDVDFRTDLHYRIGYDKTGNDRYFNDVTMPAGKGYLMALSSESMMMADGILNTGTIPVKVTNTPIGYNLPPHGHGSYNYTVDWRTLNMIGNPYQSYLDFDEFVDDTDNKTILDRLEYAVADDSQGPEVEYRYIYYVKGQSNNPYYSASRYIHPHQGFFVKAAKSDLLKFKDDMRVAGKTIINGVNSPYRGNVDYPLVNLLCFDEDGKRDLITVEVNRPEFGGGHKMEKLHESKGLIYAHLENESFQTLFAPVGINVVPVRFVPNEDGVFTLNWNTRHGEFNYLHLIDNIAGVDVDCLTNDEYKFEGKTTDYRSRFKLVFRCEGGEEPDDPEEPEDPEEEDDDDRFAFFFEDELIVNGEGLLQVFDIQGRCLLETEAIGQQSSHRLPRVAKGVYLLRLTSNKKVKIQKMVI